MKRAIVTGATSLIGIALIQKLLEEGREVYAITRPGIKRKKDVLKLKPTAFI